LKGLVFIEHNVVARHFLQSRSFDDFAERHKTMFVFPEQGHRRISQVDPSQSELPGHHERLTILPGVWHSFWIETGCVFEEVSTTHHNHDSIYRDPEINDLPRQARKTVVNHWGRYQLGDEG
jgi:D-lyxose ketol-isomerase